MLYCVHVFHSLSVSLSPCVCVTDAIVACNLNSQKHTEQLTKMAQKNVFGNAHYIIISRLCCTHVTHGCHLYNWNLRFQQHQQKKRVFAPKWAKYHLGWKRINFPVFNGVICMSIPELGRNIPVICCQLALSL